MQPREPQAVISGWRTGQGCACPGSRALQQPPSPADSVTPGHRCQRAQRNPPSQSSALVPARLAGRLKERAAHMTWGAKHSPCPQGLQARIKCLPRSCCSLTRAGRGEECRAWTALTSPLRTGCTRRSNGPNASGCRRICGEKQHFPHSS